MRLDSNVFNYRPRDSPIPPPPTLISFFVLHAIYRFSYPCTWGIYRGREEKGKGERVRGKNRECENSFIEKMKSFVPVQSGHDLFLTSTGAFELYNPVVPVATSKICYKSHNLAFPLTLRIFLFRNQKRQTRSGKRLFSSFPDRRAIFINDPRRIPIGRALTRVCKTITGTPVR